MFGKNSKEYIISLLYKEVPVRDDFYLQILSKNFVFEDENNEHIDNTIFVPKKSNLIITIYSYKTQKLYGILRFKLSKKLSDLIREYVKRKKLNIGDFLFGKQETNSDFVSKMNKSIGLSGNGGINYYRKMTISALMKTIPSPEERVALAKKMGHSPVAQLKYVRGIKE